MSFLLFPGRKNRFFFLFFLILLLLLFFTHSRWFWQIFYPLHYAEEIWEVSALYSLDPYLLLAIIYVESRFDPVVESRSGARGLMQIMPRTGSWIAESIGFMDYEADVLFDPVTNIFFGSWYLSHLLKSFSGDLNKALAAYNAGTGNVINWLGEDIWDGSWKGIEDIPFQETREYLEKVFFVYRRYEVIYKNGRIGLFHLLNP